MQRRRVYKYPAIKTELDGVLYRSQLEAQWALFFSELGVRFDYEPKKMILAKGLWYIPDFLIAGSFFAEVKPAGGFEKSELLKCAALCLSERKPVLLLSGPPATEPFYALWCWDEDDEELGFEHFLHKKCERLRFWNDFLCGKTFTGESSYLSRGYKKEVEIFKAFMVPRKTSTPSLEGEKLIHSISVCLGSKHDRSCLDACVSQQRETEHGLVGGMDAVYRMKRALHISAGFATA